MKELCMVCGRPAVNRFRHCAECLEAMTQALIDKRGGVRFVPMAAEGTV